MNPEARLNNSDDRHQSKAGYWFDENDSTWQLNKNVQINVGAVRSLLDGAFKHGFTATLAHYASTLSAKHTQNMAQGIRLILQATATSSITVTTLINFRSTLTRATEYRLGAVSGFICTWHDLGYPGSGIGRSTNRDQRDDHRIVVGFAHGLVDSQEPAPWRQLIGMFDEVVCNHELFGVHRGETHQTKDLHWLGGLLDKYEITPSGRLEFLEYVIEDHSDHTLTGIGRWFGMMTTVYTGGRRDLNYHGWLNLSCFGRAKFTEGTLVAIESEGERAEENPGFESVRTLKQEDQADSWLLDFIDKIEDKQEEISTGKELGNEVVESSEHETDN